MDTFDGLPDAPIIFVAKFNSDCGNCEFPLEIGQDAKFDGNDAVHLKCPEPRKACTTCWLVHGTHQEDCDG